MRMALAPWLMLTTASPATLALGRTTSSPSKVTTRVDRRSMRSTRTSWPSTSSTLPTATPPSKSSTNPQITSLKKPCSPMPTPTSKAAEPAQTAVRFRPSTDRTVRVANVHTTDETMRWTMNRLPSSSVENRSARRSARRSKAKMSRARNTTPTTSTRSKTVKAWCPMWKEVVSRSFTNQRKTQGSS